MQHRLSRQHVVDMCRTMLARGYLKATEGNVSVRVPGHRLYAVTPSNYDYDRMRVEDICLVDFDGKHVPDGTGADLKPSIECGMHANIYRERPDVNAIVHTHQPYASALAFLRKPIPALTDEQVRFLGREVAIIDYAPSGTGFLARNVQKKVASGDNAYIIANHGVVAVGTDPDRAVFNMALLEKVSIAYLLALTSETGRVYTIPTAIREIAFGKLRADEKRIAAQITEAVEPLRVPADEDLPSADATAAAQTATTRTDAGAENAADADAGATDARGADETEAPGAESARLGYAISEYPDVDDVMRRLKALTAQPLRGLRHDAMLDVLNYFETKCRASKEITDRAKLRIPGGVQHNLAFNYPFPLAVEKADGAYLVDRDGNTYIDFLQAGGPTILGSNYGPVNERVAEVVRASGPVTGLFHEYELKLAEIIHRYMPHVEMYRALGSGTEAVMAAVRGARAFTGKKMVIKVGGAYHGWSDTMVYGLRVPGTYRMNAKGIPFGATSRTREAFPHDLGQLKRKLVENRLRGGTAAVVVEPVGPESGTRPAPRDFNAGVRELCDEFGALLVFDEVVTGFRLGLGGAAGYFGVTPDLTVLGKAVSGGYPMAGGVGGRSDVMAVFGSGLDGKSGAHIQVGGTLSANPLSCAAGYFAIEEMARTNAPVVAGRAGDRLTRGLQRLIDTYGLPYVAYNQGSIVHLECSGVMLLDMRNPVKLLRENKARKRLMEQMGAAYTAHGIVTLAGSRMYTSLADTDEVIDDALARFDRVFAQVEGV
ncbi:MULTISPECIES: aminotransferase class III-fold pyridoxal phosphate-dependent enzyme [unclassified Micromonospora]|uniref:aminotransferase class III-fold pyridoxal phosphate-dependent enzyme n=1 Tax=unclassified Micromonospora TaxID=2617518 RepID=UPI001034D3E9|nr:aminotransferase class III-fold pyridoxal phosphate-dependent enzyme [Verrucosispora sp. SN26_14.1]TBL34534.1 aminotransferase class III-fold pyridoxal phosphate-dependent enzyme [Verrucosispora sp. SN26_14.1]